MLRIECGIEKLVQCTTTDGTERIRETKIKTVKRVINCNCDDDNSVDNDGEDKKNKRRKLQNI